MKNGYYFYKTNHENSKWQICEIFEDCLFFFGDRALNINDMYVVNHIKFGDMITMPDEDEEE